MTRDLFELIEYPKYDAEYFFFFFNPSQNLICVPSGGL